MYIPRSHLMGLGQTSSSVAPLLGPSSRGNIATWQLQPAPAPASTTTVMQTAPKIATKTPLATKVAFYDVARAFRQEQLTDPSKTYENALGPDIYSVDEPGAPAPYESVARGGDVTLPVSDEPIAAAASFIPLALVAFFLLGG